jgi:flagellar biosynthesis/type III secretory pathway M-ring protein FliF/YscJ
MRSKDEIIDEELSGESDGRYTYYSDKEVKKAMDIYSDPYKKIAELISQIFFYGNFKVETHAELELETKLKEVGLWPTTEDEIIKRDSL